MRDATLQPLQLVKPAGRCCWHCCWHRRSAACKTSLSARQTKGEEAPLHASQNMHIPGTFSTDCCRSEGRPALQDASALQLLMVAHAKAQLKNSKLDIWMMTVQQARAWTSAPVCGCEIHASAWRPCRGMDGFHVLSSNSCYIDHLVRSPLLPHSSDVTRICPTQVSPGLRCHGR